MKKIKNIYLYLDSTILFWKKTKIFMETLLYNEKATEKLGFCQNSKLFSNFCIASILIFNGVIDRWHDCGSFLTSFGFQDTQNLAVILIV